MLRLSLSFVAALTVGVASAEQRSVDDILSLNGNALLAAARAAEASKLSVPDAIRIAERLSVERDSTGGDYLKRQAFESFFKYACENADANELTELVQLYVTLDPEGIERFSLLPALAAKWIDEELKNLPSDSLGAKLESADLAVPANLENAPNDLIDAWKAFKQATRAYDLKFERRSGAKMIAFQSNERAFYRLVDDLLLKRGQGLAEKLANFGWSGGCGTGNELLSHPQSLTVFMALLHERRIAEAVGAAFYIKGYRAPMAHEIDLRIAFLEKCGLDWGLMFAGAQLDAENHLSSGWHPADLRTLAYYRSDRVASLVVKMAEHAEPQTREQYAALLAAFITRDDNNRVRDRDNFHVPRVSESQISQQTKSEIICVLEEFATPEASERIVESALGAFWHVKLPETIPNLRNLTKHRSPEVAQSAAAILSSMGEHVTLTLPSPPRPVCFQIFVNGVPIDKNLSLGWTLHEAAGGMVSAGGAKPNEEGVIEFKRESFLDSKRKPKSIALENGSSKSAREPFFDVHIPVPANLDSVTRVDVDLKPIQLTIHGPPEALPDANQEATVHIERNKSEGESVTEHIFHRTERTFDALTEQAVSLTLQPGSYQLEILLSGAERYTGVITVDGRNPSVHALLRPGADVHVVSVRPDDQRTRGYLTKPNSQMRLSYYQDKNDMFRGLPYGDYVLHIPGSADSKDPFFIDAVNYAGCDIPFTIPENSPPLVDLGTVRLNPAP